MVVFANVDWQRVAADGRAYKWFRPSCPNHCNCKTWGHGRVLRYFEDVPEGIYVQRFRCRQCGSVQTMRPCGFGARFQTAAAAIYRVLRYRLAERHWPPGTVRQRAGHWLRRLILKAALDFPGADPLDVLTYLADSGADFLG